MHIRILFKFLCVYIWETKLWLPKHLFQESIFFCLCTCVWFLLDTYPNNLQWYCNDFHYKWKNWKAQKTTHIHNDKFDNDG